jgi:glutamate N-acetyltransferase/amino-acid N-acetyltransferase
MYSPFGYRIAGMDKGAGMIHPDMGPASTSFPHRQRHATPLGCIATDAGPCLPFTVSNPN